MATRNELVAVVRERYARGSRDECGRILDEFTVLTGFHRKHSMRVLRSGEVSRQQGLRPDRRSRAQRWHDAVSELIALQAGYAVWLDALPVSLQDSATAQALQAIVDLDLDDLVAVVPPRGYGRD